MPHWLVSLHFSLRPVICSHGIGYVCSHCKLGHLLMLGFVWDLSPVGSMRAQQSSLGQAHSSFCQMPELMGFRSPSNRSQIAHLLSSMLKRILISCSVGNCKESYQRPFPFPLCSWTNSFNSTDMECVHKRHLQSWGLALLCSG